MPSSAENREYESRSEGMATHKAVQPIRKMKALAEDAAQSEPGPPEGPMIRGGDNHAQ